MSMAMADIYNCWVFYRVASAVSFWIVKLRVGFIRNEKLLIVQRDTDILTILRLTMIQRGTLRETTAWSASGRRLGSTISVGYACQADVEAEDYIRLLDCTDKALYCAKQHGRNKIADYGEANRNQ